MIFQCSEELDIDENARIDEIWAKVGETKGMAGEKIYFNQSMVMRGILVIPHSSAHCERIFSVVRKIRTEQRSSMSDHTLESLLVLKSNSSSTQNMASNLSEKKLQKLKTAYMESLNTCSKK